MLDKEPVGFRGDKYCRWMDDNAETPIWTYSKVAGCPLNFPERADSAVEMASSTEIEGVEDAMLAVALHRHATSVMNIDNDLWIRTGRNERGAERDHFVIETEGHIGYGVCERNAFLSTIQRVE